MTKKERQLTNDIIADVAKIDKSRRPDVRKKL